MTNRRDYQNYLNFLIEAGSKSADVLNVPADYPEHLRAGADYASLIAHPGWKRLLDDLERRANRALAALRQSLSSDPVVIKSLRDRWVEAEESLKFIQITASEAIDRRKQVIIDVGQKFGLEVEDDVDFGLTQQKVSDFMGAGHVSLDSDSGLDYGYGLDGSTNHDSVIGKFGTTTISNPSSVMENK